MNEIQAALTRNKAVDNFRKIVEEKRALPIAVVMVDEKDNYFIYSPQEKWPNRMLAKSAFVFEQWIYHISKDL